MIGSRLLDLRFEFKKLEYNVDVGPCLTLCLFMPVHVIEVLKPGLALLKLNNTILVVLKRFIEKLIRWVSLQGPFDFRQVRVGDPSTCIEAQLVIVLFHDLLAKLEGTGNSDKT